jgi:hypothetical protein
MNEADSAVRIALRSTDPEWALWFCEDVGCENQEGENIAYFSDRRLVMTLNPPPNFACDVQLCLLRFVDVLSLQQMEDLLRGVWERSAQPTVLLVYRNENEQDYKMSCPYCGQKLWVRDADRDKRGRCPHCAKGFTLPGQEEHVAAALRLKKQIPVLRIIRHDAGSLAGPLREILDQAQVENRLLSLGDARVISNETMRVNVEESSEN